MTQFSRGTIPFIEAALGSWQFSIRREPLSQRQLSQQYDHVSSRWHNLLGRLGYRGGYHRAFKQIIEQMDVPPTDAALQLLDCGIGTGAFSLAFAANWQGQLHLDGIDISAAMITHAADRLQAAGLDANLRQGDVCRLPYQSEQFDVVIAAHVIEHITEPTHALQEMYRVLKPGGWLVTAVTRRSLLGKYIQIKWRVHGRSRSGVESWLRQSDFMVENMNLEASGLFAQTSLVCVARKRLPSSP
ncbi:MAG: class I SAM-dependent methyltransferase [Pseudomonadota bacterium]